MEERAWVGMIMIPGLEPLVKTHIDPRQLPYCEWTEGGQTLLAESYTINDGRFPVQGCEPSQGPSPAFLAATYRQNCDADFLTGLGIYTGAAAENANSGIAPRNDTLFSHW